MSFFKIAYFLIVLAALSCVGCANDSSSVKKDDWSNHVLTKRALKESLQGSTLQIKFVEVKPMAGQIEIVAGTARSPGGQEAAFEVDFYTSSREASTIDMPFMKRYESKYARSGGPVVGVLENVGYGRLTHSYGRPSVRDVAEIEKILDDAVFGAFPKEDPNVNPVLTRPDGLGG